MVQEHYILTYAWSKHDGTEHGFGRCDVVIETDPDTKAISLASLANVEDVIAKKHHFGKVAVNTIGLIPMIPGSQVKL
jgi:hypothetical protein